VRLDPRLYGRRIIPTWSVRSRTSARAVLPSVTRPWPPTWPGHREPRPHMSRRPVTDGVSSASRRHAISAVRCGCGNIGTRQLGHKRRDDLARSGLLGAAAKERFRVGNGHLIALDVDRAPLFVREETAPGRISPASAGNIITMCVELFATTRTASSSGHAFPAPPRPTWKTISAAGERTAKEASPTPGDTSG
jgi:hypothetical protein